MLDNTTLSSQQVVDLSKQFVCVKVNTGTDGAVAAALNVGFLPDLRVLGPGGDTAWKATGLTGEAVLVAQMQSVLGAKKAETKQ